MQKYWKTTILDVIELSQILSSFKKSLKNYEQL